MRGRISVLREKLGYVASRLSDPPRSKRTFDIRGFLQSNSFTTKIDVARLSDRDKLCRILPRSFDHADEAQHRPINVGGVQPLAIDTERSAAGTGLA